MNPIIQINHLKKTYGKKEAVKGISLDIKEGELFVLLGPNGAGKTTTLKMLVGLLKPTSGSILIGGIDALKDPMAAKKQLSYVPDIPYVYDKLTPWELLRFIGKLYWMDPKIIHEEGEKLLKFFSLSDVQDTLIEEFSHGMRQKVILAASLLHNPKVFILDEPMVGLDPISIKSFKDFLREKSRQGMTIVFSTHTLTMAEELADRIGIIHNGELVALGSMDDLRKKYESKENLEHMFMKLVEKK
jgi:ABC-2 type transport system ATP-binding protein